MKLFIALVLEIPRGRYSGAYMLAAAETAIATGFVNATYADGSESSRAVLVDPFWAWPYPYGGDIIFPYYLTSEEIDYNKSMIFQSVAWLDSTKELTSLRLPNVSSGSGSGPGGGEESTRLHIFSLSLLPADGEGLALGVQFARSTNMWFEGTNKTQIVEVAVNNVGTEWIYSNHSVELSVESAGLCTVKPGVIKRLRPGDQARVQIGVENADGVIEGTSGEATIIVSGDGVKSQYTFNATFGISQYEPTYESIYQHETPQWFNDGKYGIFIHWGVYSVPAWGNSGERESYAEWYWWWLNLGAGDSIQVWEHHRDTYGENLVYDDFIPEFTASEFDPKEWVDLFVDAGAQYFVQTSKHHDGYALMDLPPSILANMGTEIMWCDIGGPNMTAEFAAEYFNSKAQKGEQVMINNRCGVPGDFDTPEYARYSAVQRRKWESNLGLDPFSYGYNQATPDSAYLDPASIVTSLVDIVSKNGNFLLDIGPTANGTIIPVMKRNLRQAGEWINTHTEAIFNTTYWYVTPEEGQAVRFTQTTDAFYIITLYAPNDTLVLHSPVPYAPGDEVTVVGGNVSGTVVPSQLLDDGALQLTISEEVKNADRYAWAFKIPF
ncbi:putative glycoside hydrolase family 29 protein [Eutypa lata UCREL1]|uniref:alpha-L-fucosidase n=1 Tax=Eutypa lata (strain UCR-EL1) TaxID=1287681 RepID=M7SSA1_EUTLA|nr:putative glycoside hydrolase family 29 protein [Eutypa lata UCREL1]